MQDEQYIEVALCWMERPAAPGTGADRGEKAHWWQDLEAVVAQTITSATLSPVYCLSCLCSFSTTAVSLLYLLCGILPALESTTVY